MATSKDISAEQAMSILVDSSGAIGAAKSQMPADIRDDEGGSLISLQFYNV